MRDGCFQCAVDAEFRVAVMLDNNKYLENQLSRRRRQRAGSWLAPLSGRAFPSRASRSGRGLRAACCFLCLQLLHHATEMGGLLSRQFRHDRFPTVRRWTMVAIRAIGSRSTQIDGRDVQFSRHIAQRDTTDELARSLNEVHAIPES
jgi:hypothetical protein